MVITGASSGIGRDRAVALAVPTDVSDPAAPQAPRRTVEWSEPLLHL